MGKSQMLCSVFSPFFIYSITFWAKIINLPSRLLISFPLQYLVCCLHTKWKFFFPITIYFLAFLLSFFKLILISAKMIYLFIYAVSIFHCLLQHFWIVIQSPCHIIPNHQFFCICFYWSFPLIHGFTCFSEFLIYYLYCIVHIVCERSVEVEVNAIYA